MLHDYGWRKTCGWGPKRYPLLYTHDDAQSNATVMVAIHDRPNDYWPRGKCGSLAGEVVLDER